MHSQLHSACAAIAYQSATQDGFVSVRSLVDHFNAKLILRPLLVEGMFAALSDDADADWGVLIDSDRYSVDHHNVASEKLGSPLPSRLRYTVAHELVHSLSFRPTEFGIKLEHTKKARTSQDAFVEEVEKHTEALSPILLCPEVTLDYVLNRARTYPIAASELATHSRNYGVSRPVLTNRLRLLPLADARRQHPALRNLGVFVADRRRGGGYQARGWPIFANFDRNIVPTIILDLHRKKNMPIADAISDLNFVLNGGTASSLVFRSTAGTPALPSTTSMDLRITAESVTSNSNSSVLVTVSRA